MSTTDPRTDINVLVPEMMKGLLKEVFDTEVAAGYPEYEAYATAVQILSNHAASWVKEAADELQQDLMEAREG